MTTTAWIISAIVFLFGVIVGLVMGGWNKAAKREVPDIKWGPISKYTTEPIPAFCTECYEDVHFAIGSQVCDDCTKKKENFERLCKIEKAMRKAAGNAKP